MQIRVLGCSGSIAAGNRTTSFLLDDDMLIDAGTGVGDLTLDELARIDQHLRQPLAPGPRAGHRPAGRQRGAAPRARRSARRSTCTRCPRRSQALRTHVFNGVIWPDFSRLPDAQHPVLRFVPIEVGQVLEFGGRQIEVLPAHHTVPAVGFAVRRNAPPPQPALGLQRRHRAQPGAVGSGWRSCGWPRWSSRPPSATTTSNSPASAATCSPALLGKELAQLDQPADVFITHIKPGELDAVMAEIGAAGHAAPHPRSWPPGR